MDLILARRAPGPPSARPVEHMSRRAGPSTLAVVQILRAAGHFAVPEGEPNQYREHLRAADLSVGTYCIPVGGKDGQDPHAADEIYVVLRG
ncbi:MAG: hypothetical protein ABW212_00290, partial [Pseudonocardia sediminis]